MSTERYARIVYGLKLKFTVENLGIEAYRALVNMVGMPDNKIGVDFSDRDEDVAVLGFELGATTDNTPNVFGKVKIENNHLMTGEILDVCRKYNIPLSSNDLGYFVYMGSY